MYIQTYLTTHENGGKLNDVRFNLHIGYGLGGLETQESSTDDSSALDVVFFDVGEHGFKIFNSLCVVWGK